MPKVVELTEGGKNKPVTADNRINYIHWVAYFRLNSQIQRAASAFVAGVHE